MREVLVDAAHARLVVVGADFHFGKGRGGDVALLQRMGAELGFEVLGVGLEAAPASRAGADLLVHPHPRAARRGRRRRRGRAARPAARGARRRGRGRPPGPRARVSRPPTSRCPSRCCLPADGIYAGTFVGRRRRRARQPRSRSAAVRRSTSRPSRPLLEAYVLDFDGDLYGQTVTVRFVSTGCAASSGSTPSTTWSRRSRATSRRPGGCSRSRVATRDPGRSMEGRSDATPRSAAARLPARGRVPLLVASRSAVARRSARSRRVAASAAWPAGTSARHAAVRLSRSTPSSC